MRRLLRGIVLIWTCAVVSAFPWTALNAKSHCLEADCAAAQLRDSVRVGYTQFPPFSRTGQSGLAGGYVIDLARLLLEPQGYIITFVPFENPTDMLQGLSAGQIDMTSLLVDNASRREFGSFSNYVGVFEVGLFVADNTPLPADVDDLVGLRVGATDGSIGFRLASQIDGLSVVPLSSGYNNLFPLLSGEVDTVAAPVESIRYLAKIAGVSHRISEAEFSLSKGNAGFLVDRNASELLKMLNQSISSAVENGHVERLYSEWFEADGVPITLRERYVLGFAIMTVLAALGYWLRLHYVVLKRAQALEARAELLRETLEATGLGLIIYDKHMRPTYWNPAIERTHPNQVPFLKNGSDLRTLVKRGYVNGSLGEEKSSEDAEVLATEFVNKVLNGSPVETVYSVATGETLRHSTQLLPNGDIATIILDVTELVSVQKRLETARVELETANIKLQDFIRLAAHDLIAPLRNVRHLHEWIRDDLTDAGVPLNDETLANFQNIETLLKRQSSMIEDLLAYSASFEDERAEAFNPKERFASILELSNLSKSFEVLLPRDPPSVLACPIAFDAVMRNLVSNGIKHHDRSSGKVEIRATAENGCCVFEVSDDGPGIPETSLEEIFEPFVRLRSRDAGAGTGLGLSLIKQRVQEWGGDIRAYSKDGQRGTTVRFTIPLAPSDLPLMDEAV